MIPSFITSALSMLITLAIAYGIDQWLNIQQSYPRMNINFQQAFLWEFFSGLLLCVVWIALSWMVLVKNRRSVAISILYIVIGLLSFVWIPLEMASPFVMKHLFLFRNSVPNLQYSGLFIAALGFLTLLFPKHKLI